MSYKLQDLNNLRLLRLIARKCSVEELSEPLQKLRLVIEERREEERLLQERYARQKEKARYLLELLRADGLSLEEVVNQCTAAAHSAGDKKCQARPAKYRFTDLCGVTKTWTGQGRMPKAMASALRQGKSLKDFLI